VNIILFNSFDEQKNVRAKELLSQIKGVRVSEESIPPTLAKKVRTPFIERPDGTQNFGLSSIEKFVQRTLAQANV